LEPVTAKKTQIRMMIGVLLRRPIRNPKMLPMRWPSRSPRAYHRTGAGAEDGGVMIGKLKRASSIYGGDYIILDVAGVGYQVLLGAHAAALPSPGEPATLSIETYVRRSIRLF
jgi:hypothetical protein